MTLIRIAAMIVVGILAAAPATATQHWLTNSSGFQIEISDTDIVATRAGRPVFSAREAAQADFNQTAHQADGAMVRIERKISVISIAGPYLSLRDEAYVELTPSAHPGGETRFWTIDLRLNGTKPNPKADGLNAIGAGRSVDLRKLVGDIPLARALSQDSFVKAAGGAGATTLDDIHDALASGMSATADQCYFVPTDWTMRSAIFGVEGSQLHARLGLPGAGTCRYRLTQLGLSIPISPFLHRLIGTVKVPSVGIKPVSITLGADAGR